MKKLKVYLDTSVIGGYFDEEFELYSKSLIDNICKGYYIGILSDITLNELSKAPQNVQNLVLNFPQNNFVIYSVNEEVVNLANLYLNRRILTKKFTEDAIHIAVATVKEVDVLVSWNFKHIVNLHRIHLFNSINYENGYKMIEIRSPKELYYDSDEE